MRRAIDPFRAGGGQSGQEFAVRLGPDEAHLIGGRKADRRRLAFDQQARGQASRRKLGVVGDVLPPEAEVLAGEACAVRPAVAGSEVQGKALSFLHIDAEQDIRHQHQILVPGHQAGIAEDDHGARIAAAPVQHAQGAAVFAVLPGDTLRQVLARLGRQAFGKWRQLPRGDQRFQKRRFLRDGSRNAEAGEGDGNEAGEERATGHRGPLAHSAGPAGRRRIGFVGLFGLHMGVKGKCLAKESEAEHGQQPTGREERR